MYDLRARGIWWILHVLSVPLFKTPQDHFCPHSPLPPPTQAICQCLVFLYVLWVSMCHAVMLFAPLGHGLWRPPFSWFVQIGVKSAPRGNYCTGVCLLYPVRGKMLAGCVKFTFNWYHGKSVSLHPGILSNYNYKNCKSCPLSRSDFHRNTAWGCVLNLCPVIQVVQVLLSLLLGNLEIWTQILNYM